MPAAVVTIAVQSEDGKTALRFTRATALDGAALVTNRGAVGWWPIPPYCADHFAGDLAALNVWLVSQGLLEGRSETTLPVASGGPQRSNTLLRGAGSVPGVHEDTPAYRRPIYPDNALSPRAYPDIWHVDQARFRQAALTIVMIGGSLTTYGANALSVQDGLTQKIERVLRRSNPRRAIDVISRGIGGQTCTTLNATPITSYPIADQYPWYTDSARPWLDYVADLNPDIVI